MNNKLNIEAAKQINLVDLLQQLNTPPTKISGNDYWYKSPLREERTASFKVDNRKNLWYDFGTGEGGNIIDFGIRYYRCTISGLLEILGSKAFSFHPQNTERQKPAGRTQTAFNILAIGAVKSPELLQYIRSRGIAIATAHSYCKEIFLQNKKTLKTFRAVGFPNNNGGWELSAPNFKSCIKPKAISFLNEQKNTLAIVEGFFDFLSAKQQQENLLLPETDWLVLNSLSMAEKAKPVILQHKKVYLLLDNDAAGKTNALKLKDYCAENNIKIENLASKYAHYKDLNEWLLKEKHQLLQNTQQQQKLKSKDWYLGL